MAGKISNISLRFSKNMLADLNPSTPLPSAFCFLFGGEGGGGGGGAFLMVAACKAYLV